MGGGTCYDCCSSLFPPYKVGEGLDRRNLLDGGFGANNPSVQADREVRSVTRSANAVSFLFSLGSEWGSSRPLQNLYRRQNRLQDILNLLNKRSTDDGTHRQLQSMSKSFNTEYYRLVVRPRAPGEIKFDEWQGKRGEGTLKLIRDTVAGYLASEDVKAEINKAARSLVAIRRARAKDPNSDRWERFCYGVEYVCKVALCKDSEHVFKERLNLRQHLEELHGYPATSNNSSSLLDKGRRYPFYSFNA